ncbi:MAG: DUF6491 family protein [Pseudomonadota bacterium]
MANIPHTLSRTGAVLALATSLTLLAGPAGLAQDAPEAASDPLEAPRCVSMRPINGYTVIDRRHLLLRSGASRRFLVTTRSNCSELRFGSQIGTSFRDFGRLCRPFVEYIYPEHGFRCAVDTIEEVESEEAARALIEARAAAEAAAEAEAER